MKIMSIHILTVVVVSEDSSKTKKIMCVVLMGYRKEVEFLKSRTNTFI